MWVEMVTYAQIFAFTHAPYPQGLCGFHDIGAQPLQSVGGRVLRSRGSVA